MNKSKVVLHEGSSEFVFPYLELAIFFCFLGIAASILILATADPSWVWYKDVPTLCIPLLALYLAKKLSYRRACYSANNIIKGLEGNILLAVPVVLSLAAIVVSFMLR